MHTSYRKESEGETIDLLIIAVLALTAAVGATISATQTLTGDLRAHALSAAILAIAGSGFLALMGTELSKQGIAQTEQFIALAMVSVFTYFLAAVIVPTVASYLYERTS